VFTPGCARTERRKSKRVATRLLAFVVAGSFAITACSSSSHSSAKTTGALGGAQTPIKIGLILSLSGSLKNPAQTFVGGVQARFNLQNQQGGIDGHPIKLVVLDDQSAVQQHQNAAQILVEQDHVFAVIDYSVFAFVTAPYFNKQGVPVVGGGFDGPEWGEQPYTNMFSIAPPTASAFAGNYYAYNTLPQFLKYIGVTDLAGVGYNIQSGIRAQDGTFQMGRALGIKQCYNNTSVPLGAVNFTAIALQVKSANCDGVVGTTTVQSTISMSQALKDAGVTAKQFYYEGYSQVSVDQPPTMRSYDGDYFGVTVPLVQTPNAATTTMLQALKQWAGYTAGIPDAAATYEVADLMVTGLKMAGSNPTRTAFITNLHKVDNYTANGLLLSPVSFQHFGTVGMLPAEECAQYAQANGDSFVPVASGKVFCGKLAEIGQASTKS
jgi:branched-chain amino acid transport system substrate-binding protein